MIRKIKIKNILLAMMLSITVAGSYSGVMGGEKVYADIGLPMAFSYDVRVINENGIIAETTTNPKKEINIPYQAIITVYDDSSEVAGRIVYGKYNETNIWFKFDENVGYASDTFDLSKVKPKDEITRYVFADGVELYNGPNKRYGRVSDNYVLPVGATVKSVYYDSLWMYIEYEGHAGWIYYDTLYALLSSGYLKNDVKVAELSTEENNSFITAVSNIVLTDTYGENGEQIDSFTVDEFTEIPFLYSISSKNIFWVYVSYQGHEGWVDASRCGGIAAVKSGGSSYNTISENGIITKEATMFSTSSLSLSIDKTIPINEEVVIKYVCGDGENRFGAFYIEYDGTNGWVDSNFILAGSDSFHISLDVETPVYDMIDGTITGTISAGTYKIRYQHSIYDIGAWYYSVKDDGEKVGWIKVIFTEDERREEERKRQEMEEKEDNIKIEILDDGGNVHGDEQIKREQTIKNTMMLLMVCFGFVSCAIILMLSLKKKKDEESNKKDEEKDSIDEEEDEEKKSEVIKERDESSVSPKEELRELEEKEDGDE